MKLRIAVIGFRASGKTSLIERVIFDHFPDVHFATSSRVSIASTTYGYQTKFVEMPLSKTPSQKDINHYSQEILDSCDAMILVASLLHPRNLEQVRSMLGLFSSTIRSMPIPIAVINTHHDRPRKPKSTTDMTTIARNLILELYPQCIGFFSVSCKTGENVSESIQQILEAAAKKQKDVKTMHDYWSSSHRLQQKPERRSRRRCIIL